MTPEYVLGSYRTVAYLKDFCEMAKRKIRKMISFSPKLYAWASTEAERLGVSFGDFVRHLILEKMEARREYVEILDEETDKRVAKSWKQYKEGKGIKIPAEALKDEKKLIEFLRQ